MKLSFLIALFQVGLVLSEQSTIPHAGIHQSKTWCVLAPGAREEQMQAFLNTACSQLVSCKAIRPGGSCYQPNTLENHASYILNLSFRRNGQCDRAIGIFSIDDPSLGRCRYP